MRKQKSVLRRGRHRASRRGVLPGVAPFNADERFEMLADQNLLRLLDHSAHPRAVQALPNSVVDLLARIEANSRPSQWAVVAAASHGSLSVHGVYDDPVECLCVADRLSGQLNVPAISAPEGWKVGVVPFYQPDVRS